ncbi:MAG TPA: PilZ domain-containing protein [Polyangia bacterium]|nr:PilZ domain-containing protein [Polyangia bacterium]
MANPRRRRSERVPCSIPVRWLRRSGVRELRAGDLNAHGMFLRCPEDVKLLPEELMLLEVVLPDRVLTAFGIARFIGKSVNGYGIGLELFVMEDRTRRAWLAYYRSLVAAHKAGALAAAG